MFAIFNTTTSKNRGIMRLVRQLVLACLKCNILFRCKHGTRLPKRNRRSTFAISVFRGETVSSMAGRETCTIPAHLTSHVLIHQIVSWVKRHSQLTRELHAGRDSIPVRRPDSQSREPGFKSPCGRFEPLASLITPRCHRSLSCINEYLAIQTVVDM